MVLTVQEYGAKIGKRSNCLTVKSSKGEKEISADKVKELHIYPACNISADAIQLCMEKDIWILFLDGYGNPKGEILPFSGGSSPIYKRNQILLARSRDGVEMVKGFLSKKIENRISQLEKILLETEDSDAVLYLSVRIKRMQESVEKIRDVQGTDMNQVRDTLQGIEGSSGRSYFECISFLMPDDMKFSQRQRAAQDVYNCVLNYLYGILYAKIKNLMYQCRLDPYIGVMHVDTYNKPTFVFDFIESQRIICEELAYEICHDRQITIKDMKPDSGGGLLFTDEGRKLLVSKFYETFKGKVVYRKKRITLERKIYMELLEVAEKIGEKKPDVLAAV